MAWRMNTHGSIQAGDVFIAVRLWTRLFYPTARSSAVPIEERLKFSCKERENNGAF
jgi:hypothetical protein